MYRPRVAKAKGMGLFEDFVRPYLKTLRKRGRPKTLRGVYDGKVYDMPGMHIEKNFHFKKRNPKVRDGLRREFDNKVRKEFLQGLDPADLRKAGFSQSDIDLIARGKLPQDWSVHHKFPLDDSGTNAHSNLVLIKDSPDHHLVTNHQRYETRGLNPGESVTTDWPTYPPGTMIWPPNGVSQAVPVTP